MILKQITPPATLPLQLDKVKEHLRVESSEEDDLLESYIAAVTSHLDGADGYLQRCLMPQTWEFRTEQALWNCGCEIEIPLPPLIAVTGVEIVAADGSRTPVDPGLYRVTDRGSMPSTIAPAGGYWGFAGGALAITYDAGYENGVPEAILQYMRMVIGDARQNRQTIYFTTTTRIDLADQFLSLYKILVVA